MLQTTMTITSNFDTLSYYTTKEQNSKVFSQIKEATNDDVFIILFRKLDGELTQRVASRIHFSNGNGGENVTFYSSMEDNTGAYRSCRFKSIYSLTKVSRSQIEKLAFAGRL